MPYLMTILFAVLALAGTAFAAPTDDLADLIADVEAYDLSQDPIEAGRLGDRDALKRLPSVALESTIARQTQYTDFLERLRNIRKSRLDADDRLNFDLLEWRLEDQISRGAFDEERMPFSSIYGFHRVPLGLTFSTVLRTPEDAEALIARLRDVPRYFDENIANMQRGIDTGFTQPVGTVDIVIMQLENLSAPSVSESPLLRLLRDLPEDWDDKPRLVADGEAALTDAVYPAFQKALTFMRERYRPSAREALGLRTVADGELYYRTLTRHFTTLDLTPEDIHAVGQREVRQIRAAMDAIIEEVGFDGSFADFQTFLRTDPQFYATSVEQLMKENAYAAKLADRQMPRFFRTLPRLSYGVTPMPAAIAPGATTAFYRPGDVENGIAGEYVVNTTALESRPLFEIPVLTIHEAVPGHHHQIALAQEIENVPEFRKRLRITAFVEGWGLYSETLCEPMGVCRTPYDRFGGLSYQMWRACRLVTDTGLHWLGWTREQAEACFRENSALTDENIRAEVDRYISFPGQALAYKIGKLKIEELRAKAEAELGDAFDIRDFHDALLLDGAVPLSILETKVHRWIDAQKDM